MGDAKIKAVENYNQSRFKSPLGEDVTALILQLAMYGREARKTLTGDNTIAHLYHDHARGFVEEFPGLEVTGAGDDAVNGWYATRVVLEGMIPAAWMVDSPYSIEDRIRYWTHPGGNGYRGRYFYEKDDGHYLYDYISIGQRKWQIMAPDGSTTPYYNEVPTNDDPPPAQGWEVYRADRAQGQYGPRYYRPAPTLRMVA